MFCEDWTLVKDDGHQRHVSALKCRRWSCDTCAPERKKQLRAKAFHGKPTKFITLTIRHAPDDDPIENARTLVRAWRLVRLRAMRQFKIKRLPFLAVFEEHENGQPHIHLLARAPFIPQKWLSDQMVDLCDSPIQHIRKAENASHAAYYVSKYLTKNPHHFGTLKRYWCSQDWDAVPADDDEDDGAHAVTFAVWRCDFHETVTTLHRCGWRLVSRDEHGWTFERGPP